MLYPLHQVSSRSEPWASLSWPNSVFRRLYLQEDIFPDETTGCEEKIADETTARVAEPAPAPHRDGAPLEDSLGLFDSRVLLSNFLFFVCGHELFDLFVFSAGNYLYLFVSPAWQF